MFFLRVVPVPGAALPRVQIADDTFRFLLEIEGLRPAIRWLVDHGCCPGAAAMLFDCEYGQTYNINSPAEAGDAGVRPR